MNVVQTAVPSKPRSYVANEVKSPVHGSYHWNAERALSIATVPLMVAPFIWGSVPMIDIALGLVIPAHTHLGFDCIITDYFPARKTKVK